MVGEVVLEEVPGLLPVDGVHGHQVGRVHPVPQEFEAHSRCSVQLFSVRLQCQR